MNWSKYLNNHHNYMKKISIIITSLCALICTGFSNPLVDRESDDAIMDFLAKDPGMLVSEHGELLLGFLQYRPMASMEKYEDPTRKGMPVINKSDYPAVEVFIKGGAVTLTLLENTSFFDIEVHPMDLETLSYIIFKVAGKERALEFAERKARLDGQAEISALNWNRVLVYLRHPENPTGRFFTRNLGTEEEKSAYSKSYSDYVKLRRAASQGK